MARVARHNYAGAALLGFPDRHVHGARADQLPHAAVAVKDDGRRRLALHAHRGRRVERSVTQTLGVLQEKPHPVGIHAPQIAQHEHVRHGLCVVFRRAKGAQDAGGPVPERVGRKRSFGRLHSFPHPVHFATANLRPVASRQRRVSLFLPRRRASARQTQARISVSHTIISAEIDEAGSTLPAGQAPSSP